MPHLYSTTIERECQALLASNTIESFRKHRSFRTSYEPLVLPTLNERQTAAWHDCASEVWITPDGEVSSTVSCHNRFCAVCSWRDARRKYAYTMRAMQELEPLNLQYLLLTVTVRNVTGCQLRQELDKLMQSINRMQSCRTWRRRVIGYIRSLETTYNVKEDTYHPHLHFILAVAPDYFTNPDLYLQTGEWREMWERSARLDYVSQVNIKPIKGDNIKGAVCEVSKYAVKLSSVIETGMFEPVQTIADAVRGRRLVAYGGQFKSLNKLLKEEDKAARTINRGVEGYVYKLVNGSYQLQEGGINHRERPIAPWVLEAVKDATRQYKRLEANELEAVAISMLDSLPDDATPDSLFKRIRTMGAKRAALAKASNG